jgi:seryl-tRNA(Sec) selenium transferase
LRLPDAGRREHRIVVQRGHVVELGGLSVAQILRIAGALPVEAGTVGRCREPELTALLAEGAASGLFIEAARGSELLGMAEFVWACRRAGVPSVVVAADVPLAALDAGADLVVVDVAQAYGGQELGLIVGHAEALAACTLQQTGLGALFRASDESLAAVVTAVRTAAADLAAGRAVPAW